MPPKAQKQNAPKGSKVAIDKTFGMKNKNKSAKVQEKAAVIQQQQARKGLSEADIKKQEAAANAKRIKAEEAARLKAQMELFKPQQAQKVPFGVDPKTVLCQYFAAGFCDKGVKCKFSHDKNIGRKTEKKNLYTDDREGVANPGAVDPNDKKLDTMDTWDDDKLAKVVLSKAGNPKTSTDIVCKFFIQAIEDQKYGWFWECPNGVECKYRHALPPGYVLNSEKKKKEAEAKAKVITLEEFLESERHKLGKNLTPVTAETFATWKKTRLDAKTAQEQTANKLKQQAGAAGKMTGMSGKDLFTFNPDWYNEEDDNEGDDGDAWDLDQYRKDEDGNPIEAERDDDDDDAETTRSGLPPRSEAGTSDAGLERSVAGLSVAGDEPAESQDGATSRDG